MTLSTSDRLVVGVDLSLTETGLALIYPTGVIDVWTIKSKAPKEDTLATRYIRKEGISSDLAGLVRAAAVIGKKRPLVVIEGPAFASKYGKQWDRAGLWWDVVSHCFQGGFDIVEVPPNVRAKYGAGKAANKDVVLASVIKRYPDVEVTNNNVADALLLAAMGRRFLGSPIEESLPQTHLDAMKSVKWESISGEE